MNNNKDNVQLTELSRRIADERDPEKLIALAKELDQCVAKKRGDVERKEITSGE